MSTVGSPITGDFSFQVPATGMTLAQFRDWAESDEYPDQGKVMYFLGELYFDMSPERVDSHAVLKSALNYTIEHLNRQCDLGRYYPDGVGLENKQAGVANEPDAYFAKWETIESGRLAAPPEKQGKHTALVGSPDWVCEITSDSSVEKDTKILRTAYHAAEIPEYWILDARGDEIVFQLLTWQQDGYSEVSPVDGWRHSAVFDLDFQITRQRDQAGGWRYDIEYK